MSRNRGGSLLLATVLIGLPLGGARAQDADGGDDVKAHVQTVLENYLRMFERDFRVTVTSKELQQVFAQKISQSLPMPIPVGLKHLLLTYTDGKGNVKVRFSQVPPAIKQLAEQKADEMIGKSFIGKALPQITYSAIRDAMKVLKEEAEVRVTKKTDGYMDVEAQVRKPFLGGKKITLLKFRIDTTRNLVSIAKIGLENEQHVAMKIEYKPVSVPGQDAPLNMQSKNTIVQNAFLDQVQIPLPARFTVDYSDYKFKKL